jgi:hypothetical protein
MRRKIMALVTATAFAGLAVAAPPIASPVAAQTTGCATDHGVRCGSVTITTCDVWGPGYCLISSTRTYNLYNSYL